ncbi:MAG: VOC family protein [Solirubrobacterales bacterium]|nr:VOC family protein [Solirubrobacterales bacterium]
MRAFPVLYAKDVEGVAAFYVRLGFVEHARLPGQDGSAGFIGLARDGVELGVTIEESPRLLAGVEPGPGPRHELFVYVEGVDEAIAALRESGTPVVSEPADMPWGERVGFVADPEGNLVSLAASIAYG